MPELTILPHTWHIIVDGLAFIIIIDEHVRQSFNNVVLL